MYPVLPFGPMTIPTAPIVALIATTLGLEIAGRYGRRLGLQLDNVWNAGLFAILAGLIVARLWNVIQFWPVYIAEPWLMISVRPSGFAVLPGIWASGIMAYGYMMRHALDPARVTAALGLGVVVGFAIIQAGMLLSGTLTGVISDLPWAMPYYDELRHPVALYYAVGLMGIVIGLWWLGDRLQPNKIVLLLLFGCGIVYLSFAPFEYQPMTFDGWRIKQFCGLFIAIISALFLARLSPSRS